MPAGIAELGETERRVKVQRLGPEKAYAAVHADLERGAPYAMWADEGRDPGARNSPRLPNRVAGR